jgi:hypothetical protein
MGSRSFNKTAAKIEEASEAMKRLPHQVENIICCYQNKAKDIVAEKQSCKHTSLKDGLVEC